MELDFEFVPAGTVANETKGKLYIDVGNAFCPGILDHHHPDAPSACTAILVLNHPEYVSSQVVDDALTIIPHQYPDLDAVTGAYFSALHARGEPIHATCYDWANYVCKVDQGFTTLTPVTPMTPYSLFMMRMHLLRDKMPKNTQAASLIMLESGFSFLDIIFDWLQNGGVLDSPEELEALDIFFSEKKALNVDLKKYEKDIKRAEIFACKLPKKDAVGCQQVQGLWLTNPESSMFKSWARGDVKKGGADGFVFLGIQVNEQRFILSVNPSSDVYLKGLGDLLEKSEVEKRKCLGLERQGNNRPGYDSPDPWYDGRSPLHNYTIIDVPRAGTILKKDEVQNVFQKFLGVFE